MTLEISHRAIHKAGVSGNRVECAVSSGIPCRLADDDGKFTLVVVARLARERSRCSPWPTRELGNRVKIAGWAWPQPLGQIPRYELRSSCLHKGSARKWHRRQQGHITKIEPFRFSGHRINTTTTTLRVLQRQALERRKRRAEICEFVITYHSKNEVGASPC